jgi:hypothetical protein
MIFPAAITARSSLATKSLRYEVVLTQADLDVCLQFRLNSDRKMESIFVSVQLPISDQHASRFAEVEKPRTSPKALPEAR